MLPSMRREVNWSWRRKVKFTSTILALERGFKHWRVTKTLSSVWPPLTMASDSLRAPTTSKWSFGRPKLKRYSSIRTYRACFDLMLTLTNTPPSQSQRCCQVFTIQSQVPPIAQLFANRFRHLVARAEGSDQDQGGQSNQLLLLEWRWQFVCIGHELGFGVGAIQVGRWKVCHWKVGLDLGTSILYIQIGQQQWDFGGGQLD